MKKYRVIQGIILFTAIHTVPGTLLAAAGPLDGLTEIATIKPTVVNVGNVTYTATSGDRLHVSKPGEMPVMYDVTKEDNGTIKFSSPDAGDVTCNSSTMKCSDPNFENVMMSGLPGTAGSGGDRSVIVSAKVPGASCICYAEGEEGQDTCSSSIPVEKIKYKCSIGEGLSGFQSMFASIIRYVVYIVTILSVLAIVGLGIAWSLAGGDDAKAKSELKKWGINILIGMIILFFFRYILQFIAPWIYN